MFLLIAFNSVLVAQKTEWELDADTINKLNEFAIMFEGQPAITEDEIKKHIQLFQKFHNSEITDKKIKDIARANRIGPIRLKYIFYKVDVIILFDEKTESMKDYISKWPEVLKPSKEEIALVNKYM